MVRNQRKTITRNIKRTRVNKKKTVKRSLLSSFNLTKKHAIIIIVAVVIVITISIGLAIGLKKRNTAPTEVSTTTKAPTEASTTTTTKAPTTTTSTTTTTTKAPTTTTSTTTTTTTTKALTTTTTTKAPTTAAKKLTNTPTTSDDITIVPDNVLPPDTDLGDDELNITIDGEDQKDTPEPTNNNEGKMLKTGVVVGIILGASVGAVILILIIVFFVMKKKQNSYTRKVTYPVSGTYVNPMYNPNLKPKVPSFHNRNRLYSYTPPNPVSNPLYGSIQRPRQPLPRLMSNPVYGFSNA